MTMFCWHLWQKWSDPHNGVFGDDTGFGYFAVAQIRTCEKCGKAEVRKLPKMRSLSELKAQK